MPDLTNQQLLEAIRQEFATKEDLKIFATKDDLKHEIISVNKHITKLEAKIDSHRDRNVEQHLKILEEIGYLNRKFTDLSERQDGLGKRFSKLRIVTE